MNPNATDRPASSSPGAVRIDVLSDPTAVADGLEVVAHDAVQLTPKPLRGRRVVVRLGGSVLMYYSVNSPVRSLTTLEYGRVAFVTFGPRASGTVNGLLIRPDRVVGGGGRVAAEFVVAGGYESVSCLMCESDARRVLDPFRRQLAWPVQDVLSVIPTAPGAGRALFRWGQAVARAAVREPAAFDDSQVRTAAGQEMAARLQSSLESGLDHTSGPEELASEARSRIVRTAEQFALSRAGYPPSLTELCEATGVSERTLQYAFRAVLGLSPVAYLARLRLHRVRQALRTAEPHSTTVSAEALRWGFWHFGDFAGKYKACFGECPSQTLRQACGYGPATRQDVACVNVRRKSGKASRAGSPP